MDTVSSFVVRLVLTMDPPLPPGWTRYVSDDDREYFHNSITNITQWDRPELQVVSDVYQYKPASTDFEIVERSTPDNAVGFKSVGMDFSSTGVDASRTHQYVSTDSDHAKFSDAPGGNLGGASTGDGNTSALGRISNVVGSVIMVASSEDGTMGVANSILAYAQQFFDVCTDDVVRRLQLSVTPFLKQTDVAANEFRTKPDFWGPLWIATTAVLFLAASGNFACLLAMEDTSNFKADYGLVSIASTMIYGCLLAVPILTRVALCASGQEPDSINFRQMICVYGYSLTSTIPASILCLIPFGGARWLVVLIGLSVSLLFIQRNLWVDLSVEAPSLKWSMIVLLCAAQAMIFFVYRVHFLP